MNIRILSLLVFITFIATTSALQWYQQGHTAFLTEKNFNSAINEPGKYKFVKFFTHNCRYCRMLKQVMEQLYTENKWPIRFYDVDCSKHYDLCVKTVNAHSFPFVGIYDIKGNLEASIKGYYPVDVMRDALKDITSRQKQAIKALVPTVEGIAQKKVEQKVQDIQEVEQIVDKTTNQVSENSPATIQTVTPEVKVQTPTIEQTPEEESSSVTQGIKILIILLGFWMFKKQVKPFLDLANDSKNSRSRTVQIPLSGNKQYMNVKTEDYEEEGRGIMSQTI